MRASTNRHVAGNAWRGDAAQTRKITVRNVYSHPDAKQLNGGSLV